jgi:hypothetical protein
MPEEIKVPGVGGVDRKWVLAGGAAVAGIVIYAYWRRSQSAGEEPAGEGDEYVSGDEWTPDAYIGATQPGGATYDPIEQDDVIDTNAEWAQRVVDLLEGVGYERNTAAVTIGKYLAGQPLSATEKLTVQAAIALLGNPPGGALPIYSAPETPTTPPPATATKLATPTMRASAGDPRNTNYALSWTRIAGATLYLVKRERGPGVNPLYRPTTGTTQRTHALKRGWVYQYRVQAQAIGKTPSNWSNPVSFKVPG